MHFAMIHVYDLSFIQVEHKESDSKRHCSDHDGLSEEN